MSNLHYLYPANGCCCMAGDSATKASIHIHRETAAFYVTALIAFQADSKLSRRLWLQVETPYPSFPENKIEFPAEKRWRNG